MGIFYKIPISAVAWGRREFYEVIRSLLGAASADAARDLAVYVDQHFDGRLTLVNSGRSALELALRRIRQQSDKANAGVLTPSLICRAVPDKIVAAGLTPIFYDVAPDLSPSLESLVEAARPETVAVVFPYLYGKVVPADSVARMCKNAGMTLIEDCAASFLLPDGHGRLSGTTGDYVVFSFQRGKTTVAGGGGALLDRTGSSDVPEVRGWTSQELQRLYFSKIAFMLEEVFLRTGYAIQKTVGSPSDFGRSTMEQIREISGLDCSLVLIQLERWPSIFEAKSRILRRYVSNLAGDPYLHFPQALNGGYANRMFVKFSRPIVSRPAPDAWTSSVADYMRKRGVEVHFPYFPVHRMANFAQYSGDKLRMTDEFCESLLEIPSQPSLRDHEIDYVSKCLLECARFSS